MRLSIVAVCMLALTIATAFGQSSPLSLLESQIEDLRTENASLRLQLEQLKGQLESTQAALATALGDDADSIDAAMRIAKESGSLLRMIQVKVTSVKEQEPDEKALAQLDALRETEQALKKEFAAEEKEYRTMESANNKARNHRSGLNGKKSPQPQPHSDATMKVQNSRVKQLEAELKSCTNDIRLLSGTTGKRNLVVFGTGIDRPESTYEIRVSGNLVAKAERIHIGDAIAFAGVAVDTTVELQIFNARKLELLEQ